MRVIMSFTVATAVSAQGFMEPLPVGSEQMHQQMERQMQRDMMEMQQEMQEVAAASEMMALPRAEMDSPSVVELQLAFGNNQAVLVFEAPQVRVVTHEVHQQQQVVNGEVVVETEVLDCVGDDCRDKLTVQGPEDNIVVTGPGPIPYNLRGVAEQLAVAKRPCDHAHSAAAMPAVEDAVDSAEAAPPPTYLSTVQSAIGSQPAMIGAVCASWVLSVIIGTVLLLKCRNRKNRVSVRELSEPLASPVQEPVMPPMPPSECFLAKQYVHRLYARASA